MLELVKTRLKYLGYELAEADYSLVDFITTSTGQYIKNFCNVERVPMGLMYVWVDAICGEFLYQKKSMGALSDFDFERAVTSIKEGDTQVNLSEGQTPEQQFDACINAMRQIDVAEMLRYRRLVW